MSSSPEQPQPSPDLSASLEKTGIQTSAGVPASPEAPSLPLPPTPQPPPLDAAQLQRQCGMLDAVLAVVVVLFAFLVASFPASNPDFFAQAATGRLILQGEYHFGVDPFIYSADDSDYFVNHSWLFALLMYGLYQLPAVGGAAVVIFKALVTTALAVILLRAGRRPGHNLWIAAACTALAILVLSPRLYLQSTCLSFLFLGVTIWLLIAAREGRQRLLWLLPPLFALWVNCDQWFFLGPLALALYLGGELLQQALSSNDKADQPEATAQVALADASGWLWVVLAVGLAACLLNPHHIHAFRLPPELGLSAAGDLVENDPQFHTSFLSPLRADYYNLYLGLNAAGLAYWPLLILGLASFVFVFGRVPWWRLLVWMGFALLSLYNVRGIPFFAIVSGPIMALNWQDYAAELLGPAPLLTTAWRNWSLGGRALTLLLGVVLLLAAAPGWLHNQPQLRQLGWSVSINPSLKAMADTIREWRQAGKLGSEEPHWFNLHTEVANYLAYFAPGERVYLDQGIAQFRKAAEDYQDIRQGLAQMLNQQPNSEGEPGQRKDWQRILRERHIHFWILDNQTIGASSAFRPELNARIILFRAYKDWVLCYMKGGIAIFAWHDPAQPGAADPSAGLALDLKRAAFGAEAEPAPPHGPEAAPARNWWQALLDNWWPANPPRSIDADSVALYETSLRYLVEYYQQRAQHSRAWGGEIAASAIAAAPSPSLVPNNLLALNWWGTYNELFPDGVAEPVRQPQPAEVPALSAWFTYVNGQFYETPSLYLAVRAARRALLVNPDDGMTAFRLAQIYQQLRELPHERSFQRMDPVLASIRTTQMAGAYQNCLRLPIEDDKAADAHLALYELFKPEGVIDRRGVLDAAVHHLREALNKRTAAGLRGNTSVTEFNRMLEQMSEQLTQLDSELERRMDRYKVNASGKSRLDQVKAALQERLIEIALDLLEHMEPSELSELTAPELAFVHQMAGPALDLGRLDVARNLLPQHEDAPVPPEEMTLHLRLAAARGDYAEAEQLLADALQHAWKPPQGQRQPVDPRASIGFLLGSKLLGEGQRAYGTMIVEGERLPGAVRVPWVFVRQPQVSQTPTEFWLHRWPMDALVDGMIAAQQDAGWQFLRGWLALESGRNVEASKHLRAVHSLVVPAENWVPEVNRLNAWMFPQEEIKRLNQLGYRHNVLAALSREYLNWLKEAQ